MNPIKQATLSCLLLSATSVSANVSKGPILDWVSLQSQNHQVMDPDSINLGWSLFNETQLRFETDRDGIFSDQEVRFTIKPLFGMANEHALVDHQKTLKKLYQVEEQNRNLLYLYRKILQTWKILQIKKVFGRSASLFAKAQRQLKQYSRGNRALTASLIDDLAFYVENKAKVDSFEDQVLAKVFQGDKHVVDGIQTLDLLPPQSIQGFVEKLPKTPNSDIESQEKQLQEMQFTQKKMENRQLLKFVSMSRQKGINRFEDYRVQLAIRVPFLSDSLEFEEAKTEYLREGQKIHLAKLQKQEIYDEILAELRASIKKNEVLQWAPQKSYGNMKVSGQMGTLSEAVKSEVQLLKIQVAAIENRVAIMDSYLRLLVMNNQLDSVQINYLTQPAPTLQ